MLAEIIIKMTINQKNLLIKILTIIGIIPAIYLLGLSLIFLPNIITNLFKHQHIENSIIIILILFGICGFIGLIIQLFTHIYKKVKLKIILLSLSLIGYFGFFTFINGMQSWINIFDSFKNFKENYLEIYFVVAPVIVSVILIGINIRLSKNSTSANH